MSSVLAGALLGAACGVGLLVAAWAVLTRGRARLEARVTPYLRDLNLDRPTVSAHPVRWLAAQVEQVLGGASSVRRRLGRAGLDRTVGEFRIEQVHWGAGAFAAAALYCVLTSIGDADALVSSTLICAAAFAGGVMARDWWLSQQVRARDRQVLTEFPALAELMALSVAAGEGAVAALDRVVARSGGALSADLGAVLGQIRTGTPVAVAFDDLAARSGVPVVARFAQGVAIAVERGTPLADVLHAQAADVREAGRRELIEVAARKEIAMLMPVVFGILPVAVMFAFWPGLVGLHLTVR